MKLKTIHELISTTIYGHGELIADDTVLLGCLGGYNFGWGEEHPETTGQKYY